MALGSTLNYRFVNFNSIILLPAPVIGTLILLYVARKRAHYRKHLLVQRICMVNRTAAPSGHD